MLCCKWMHALTTRLLQEFVPRWRLSGTIPWRWLTRLYPIESAAYWLIAIPKLRCILSHERTVENVYYFKPLFRRDKVNLLFTATQPLFYSLYQQRRCRSRALTACVLARVARALMVWLAMKNVVKWSCEDGGWQASYWHLAARLRSKTHQWTRSCARQVVRPLLLNQSAADFCDESINKTPHSVLLVNLVPSFVSSSLSLPSFCFPAAHYTVSF